MIFLSAGHSEADPGAVAFGRKEADIAVEFRNIVSFYLLMAGVKHATDGVGRANIPLAQAVRLMGKNRPALEFHCNAGPATASGVETLSGANDMVLGASICKAISDVFGIPNRGAKAENSGQHHRLAFVQAGGVIVELFFLTSAKDLAAYDAKKWLAARAVAQVLTA